jgi:hypothetical protein
VQTGRRGRGQGPAAAIMRKARQQRPGSGVPSRPGASRAESAAAATWPLLAAGVAVLAFYAALRAGVGLPWSYDDYFHLGVAREMARQGGPLESFPWTPFSVLAERYVDKEPLFHLLLVPLAGLPLARSAAWGPLLGQAFLVGAAALLLRGQRIFGAAGWLLGLVALGPFFANRLEHLRPHVFMLGFCVLLLALLLRGTRPWILGLVCGLFALFHVAAWVAIPFALVWSVAQRHAPIGGSARLTLWPPLVAATGWTCGQLLHPNLPHNFWLAWTVNVTVPLASAGGASRSLREAIGLELQPMGLSLLLLQWPALVPSLVAVARLARHRAARTPAALTLTALAAAFLLGAVLLMARLFEIGALLGLLAAAQVTTDALHGVEGRLPFRGGERVAWLALLLVGAAWTVWQVRDFGRGDLRPLGNARPIGMAEFLGARGRAGELVFTAQWADSAPLFWAAPRLRSLVVLDPTFFHAHDPSRFARYWAIAQGRSGDPVGEIRRSFGARYVTVWKAPAFVRLAQQLRRDRRAARIYEDASYEVWELADRG